MITNHDELVRAVTIINKKIQHIQDYLGQNDHSS